MWNDSVENKSGAYDVSPQTARNYVEKQGMEVIDWKEREKYPLHIPPYGYFHAMPTQPCVIFIKGDHE